jgi:cytochrome c-type biogenesis protein CcmH/NrfF
MTEVRDFVAALARAGKSRKEIKPLVGAAYGDKTLSKSQINRILKAVKEGKSTSDQRYSNAKKPSGLRTLWPLSPPLLRRTAA